MSHLPYAARPPPLPLRSTYLPRRAYHPATHI